MGEWMIYGEEEPCVEDLHNIDTTPDDVPGFKEFDLLKTWTHAASHTSGAATDIKITAYSPDYIAPVTRTTTGTRFHHDRAQWETPYGPPRSSRRSAKSVARDLHEDGGQAGGEDRAEPPPAFRLHNRRAS